MIEGKNRIANDPAYKYFRQQMHSTSSSGGASNAVSNGASQQQPSPALTAAQPSPNTGAVQMPVQMSHPGERP